jgi:hypothetical protein
MSLIKLNDRAVKDVTEFGSISSLGSLTHISTATASSSASIEFTSGIDSTYKEYVFYFVNIHPATNDQKLQFNMSADAGSNYNITKTTTVFRSYHNENDGDAGIGYSAGDDLAQSTAFQSLTQGIGNPNNDENASGSMILFNPSSTTFVKHFIANTNAVRDLAPTTQASYEWFTAGYGNTTSPVNAIKFQMASGNIDAGQILLFGVN